MRLCTGLTATWCPVHGDCTCPRDAYGACPDLDSTDCPLHCPWGDHPITRADIELAALLDEAGVPEDVRVELDLPAIPAYVDVESGEWT